MTPCRTFSHHVIVIFIVAHPLITSSSFPLCRCKVPQTYPYKKFLYAYLQKSSSETPVMQFNKTGKVKFCCQLKPNPKVH